ncbi:antigen peptide transporter 1 [Hyla sarda]|uniref:antigen peptide transporter 1 n=1 Tax=Hyla sarda TaxID=327740 RepID=UPI0024C3AA6B|nr:antigen peptide transporter 1 [Hyla sarda]
MHLLWSLCCLLSVDYAALHLLKLSLTLYLPINLLLVWVTGLARLVVLTLGVRAVNRVSKLPRWLQGEPLLVSSAALSLLVPSCATFTALLLPRTSAELLHRWAHGDLFIFSYLITLTSAVVWHQLFLSDEDEEDEEESSASVWRLLALLKPYGWRFLWVSVFLVLSSWSEMALPAYTGKMTDWIQEKKDPSIFWNSIIAISLITLSSAVTEFICDCIYNITMSLVHTQTQGKLLHAILRQDITFFDTVSTGDITSRITTDITAMSEALSHNLSLLMWYFMRLVFLVFYMLSLSTKLTLFTMLCLLVTTIVPKLSGAFYQNLAMKVQKSLSEANQVALEIFSNMKTVRSFANEEGECQRYETKLEHTYELNKMEAVAYGCTSVANSLSGLVIKVVILYFGGRLVTNGEVSGGELVSFVLYELQFTSAVEVLQHMYPDVRKAVGSSEKVFEFMDRTPQLPPPGNLKPTHLRGHVQFKNVSFSYPKRPDTPALQDVSFELHEGQVTALVGACDAGKSTVVQLLLKFYQPQKGQVLLDGKPLSDYDNEYYRKEVSVVSQEPVLTARSLKDNISYGLGKTALASVRDVAAAACADDFISGLADGYNTGAGQKGGLLSGGQKQRVALARALLRDPKILILDDVSSSLDTETELKIQSTVYGNTKKRTVLLISHRMNIVKEADHILVLEGGQIRESGKHEELLAKRGVYWKSWEKQRSTFYRENGEM